MNISDEDIAKLVLGYLRSEKCKGAAELFLESSRHLRHISSTVKQSKHFITHVYGYCLTEIIREYSKLYTIIIEYLEEATYPNEFTSRDMPSKLIYLLENAKRAMSCTPCISPRSRSSTPIKQYNSMVHKPKRRTSQTLSAITEISSPKECETNATPLHELPGNTNIDNTDNSIAKVLAETLLENRELQEKLAENINSVIQNPLDEHVGSGTSETTVNNELNTTIKAIVHKTEHDPVFEQLLNEIIGTNDESGGDDQDNQAASVEADTSAREINNSIEETPQQETAKTDPKQTTEPLFASSKKQIITMEGTKVDADTNQNLTVNTNTGEVILYDGTLESYMKEPTNSISASTSVTSTTSSNLVLNTGLLMVQPPVVQQPQPYYMWSGSQLVGVPQYKVNNLSEQDILTMPTVIVCDENQQIMTASSMEGMKQFKKIAPNGPLKVDVSARIKPAKQKKKSKKTIQKGSEETIPEIKIEILNSQEENNKPPDVVDSKVPVTRENLESKKTPKQATPKSKSAPKKDTVSTPKSGSHVRALDFNFGTPRQTTSTKKAVTSPKRKSPASRGNQTKISKSLFGSPSKSQKKTPDADKKTQNVKKSWDADLRALAGAPPTKIPSPKRKSSKRKDKKKQNLNKTEQDAKAIEDNLKIDNKTEEKVGTDKTPEVEQKEPTGSVQLVQKDPEERPLEETDDLPFTLINYNRAPRIKRKCNIDGNINREVHITKVKQVKNLEISSTKTILSPSKLNANKRTLVDNRNEDNNLTTSETKNQDSEVLKPPVTPSIYGADNEGENEILALMYNKNLTPENTKIFDKSVLKASINLTPLLETPFKKDVRSVPKTPTVVSPINIIDTPLTKMFKQQLEGLDITSIQTPKFPITPNLAITPLTNEKYENRPTDYSTSSSYYQPSDTEQNKSIEQLIEDSKKVGKLKNVEENVKNTQERESGHSDGTNSIANKLSNFNRSVIGKKNLSLVSKTDTVSFEDSDSDENWSEIENLGNDSSGSDSSVWSTKSSKNVTVIQAGINKPAQSRYPLRSRNKEKKQFDEVRAIIEENINNTAESETKEKVDKTSVVTTNGSADNIKDQTIQQKDTKNDLLFAELERKRQQTIAIIKQPPSSTKQKSATKQKNPPKPRRISTTKRKSVAPKKATNSTPIIISDNLDIINPINFVEAQLGSPTSSVNAIDFNQEYVITDSKEHKSYSLPNKQIIQIDPPDDNSSTELLKALSLKKRDSNKSFEAKLQEVKNEEKKTQNLLQEDLNLTDSFTEEIPTFDFCIKSDFDFNILHDPDENNVRNLKDYDLKCLNEKYSAEVFVDELNMDIVREMTVTPMKFILDVDPTTQETGSGKVKILNMVTLKDDDTSKTLHKKFSKGNTTIESKFPSEKLFGETSEKLKLSKRRKSVEPNKKSQQIARKSVRSESIDEQRIKMKNQKSTKSLDLMDYAIIGDKPSPNSSSTEGQGTKRKATEDVTSEKSKSLKQCDELLSGLDVDTFLSKIYKD